VNLTDTHCHLDLDKFDSDRGEVLDRAWGAGLTRILVPGLNLVSSAKVVQLAESHARIFAAIGVHPNDALTWNQNSREELKRLYKASGETKNIKKIVAIGEIGLDYYWDEAPHALQKDILHEQLDLALELGLPVILHLREKEDVSDGDCAKDLVSILKAWTRKLNQKKSPLAAAPGVLHSFSAGQETARSVLDLNFYIGITGPVTYKNAEQKREVVKSLPLERMLIETDAPFLAPVPMRGRRNEPAFVCHITDKIAEIHNKNPKEIAALTCTNAARLFSWGG